MASNAIFLALTLGCGFLVAGVWTHRRELLRSSNPKISRWGALGPIFIAAALAAFAGEHFTLAKFVAEMVPPWLPARLFLAYFVGGALLAAALSLIAERYVSWSMVCLATMFGLFVLLMDLPAAIKEPANRLHWILATREATFSIGALALFSRVTRDRWPRYATGLASVARFWTGMVIIFYGVQHLLHPECSPGVPSLKVTEPWVPSPFMAAYVTGVLLIFFGAAMLVRRYASLAATSAGALMLLLTVVLYVPQLLLGRNHSEQILAINYIFDTLLFSGVLFAVASANPVSESDPVSVVIAEPEHLVQ